MTLDDLLDEFKRAVERQPWSSALGYDARLAGIRAVVEALRDACYGCEHHLMWDEILASDGVEAAGGNVTNPSEGRVIAPAAAPVCEWTKDTHPDDGSHYDTACGDAWCSILGGTPKQDNYSFCPSCGKPITFKEDSE
jgi:rubredoxin